MFARTHAHFSQSYDTEFAAALISSVPPAAPARQPQPWMKHRTNVFARHLRISRCPVPARARSGLLVCVQEMATTSNPLSARRSMCLADRPQPAGHPGAREMRRRDDLAFPQAHALGSRCRARMIRGPTSGKRSILSTSSRSLELPRRAGPGRGPHAKLVSLAAQAVCAYAERCCAPLVCGSLVRCSGA